MENGRPRGGLAKGFAAVTDSLDAAMYIADMETYELLFMNASCRRLHGDGVGRRCWQVLRRGLDGPCETCANSRLVGPDGEPSGSVTHEDRDARTGRWYECRDYAIAWDEGRLVHLTVSVDITEHKLLEMALGESEERLRAFVDNSFAAIALSDEDGRITVANAAAQKILGLPRDEITGRHVWELPAPVVAPQAAVETEEALREALASGRGEWLGKAREIAIRRSDGGIMHLSRMVFAIPGGKGFRLATITSDVTELKLAQAALRESEARLAESRRLEAVGTLAGGMAHYFNNYLTVVLGYAALLQSEGLSEENRRRYAQEISEAGTRAVALNRKLQGYSARQTLASRRVDVTELARRIGDSVRRSIAAGVSVRVEIQSDIGHAILDPWLLERAILAVAANGCDAMPRGGVLGLTARRIPAPETPWRDSLSRPPRDAVRIEVTDTGQGMDEETASRLFEPFFTTRGNAQREGLGMSMAYGAIRQHGGVTECHSAPGAGTTVSILLPLEGPEAGPS